MSDRHHDGPAYEPYLEQRVRDALACEEGELGVTVSVTASGICITGVVQTRERRARIECVCRRIGNGYEVVNRIEVCPPSEPELAETLS
jgi:hypothetical protein